VFFEITKYRGNSSQVQQTNKVSHYLLYIIIAIFT